MPLRTIYVELLTTGWLKKQGFDNAQGPVRVFYFDSDDQGLALAKKLSCLGSFSVEKMIFKCADVVDQEGVSARLKVIYQELGKLGTLITKDAPQHNEARLGSYLLKAPLSSYDLYSEAKYSQLWHAVGLINVVRWHSTKISAKKEIPEFHLFERPFFEQLKKYASAENVKLCPVEPFRSPRALLNKARKISSKLNPQMVKALLLHAVVPKKDFSKALDPSRSMILVDTHGQFNLDRKDLSSDLFFADKDAVSFKDVLLSFNGTHDPIDQGRFKAMKANGIEAVAMTPQSCLVSPAKVRVFQRDRSQSASPMSHPRGDLTKDLSVIAGEYWQSRAYWEDFFFSNNVKLWTSFYKNEPQHIAKADALAAVGGISTIYQRSFESNPTPILAVGSDIIFGFSTSGYEIEKANGSDFRYHITTGYLGDYRFEHLSAGAKVLRELLTKAGAKHIIAYFDETTINDERWFMGHEFVQDNYSFWLEKLLQDTSLGLIFKPKIHNTLRRRLGKVANLLARAEATGRCYVFEKGSLQNLYPPAAASLASDMAIHEMLTAGTAGLESALAGTRTLLMDFEGWPSSPLYKLGDQVVFRHWDKVWQSCSGYFKDPMSHSRLGDWSAMIQEFDPFHDGLAAHRMGIFLKELLEGLRRNEKPVDIMDRAAANYAKRWGKDKVQRA